MGQSDRPLSPHLQVYRPQLNSVMSISHRFTGLFLGLGALFLTCWLVSLAAGPTQYSIFHAWVGSVFGRAILLGWTFSLFYHLCNGIRHLFWDAGYGYELRTVFISGWAVLISSSLLTGGLWFWVFFLGTRT
ncbi:MAG: succinate dehydrogenase, cytochrome b556 subunit [Pseudomonadota bacterium]|nr:succinate dehydrogenase, cytochrome b556 subunit [Pseudomonadota bacterium]